MLTEEQINKYLKDPNQCPYCNSKEISYTGEDDANFKDVHCKNCKKNWLEVFQLIKIEEVDEDTI
jgi:transcription elongation factor Elf1